MPSKTGAGKEHLSCLVKIKVFSFIFLLATFRFVPLKGVALYFIFSMSNAALNTINKKICE